MDEWKNDIENFMSRSLEYFLKDHVQGKLNGVKIIMDIKEGDAEITLSVNDMECLLDYDVFQIANEECERDSQRECYFENEVIWSDFYNDFGKDIPKILNVMHEVAKKLSEHYNVLVNVDLVDD